MSKNENNNGGGIGLLGLLQVAFIVLKLCGVIHWNWVWVLAPLWIPIAIVLAIVVVMIILEVSQHGH